MTTFPGVASEQCRRSFGSPEAQEALRSWPGRFLISWLAVRDTGISYDDVSLLVFPNQDEPKDVERADLEHVRLLDVLFASRRTATKEEGQKRDISTTWCQSGMATLAREIGVDAIGKLSYDQFEWLSAGGIVDEHAEPSILASGDRGTVEAILETAKAIAASPNAEIAPEVIEAYERALKAFEASGEVPSSG